MKKSMAGKKVAGTLLLAGLMMSAGAMAASGDPVQGGSGSVAINVPIVASTCSVSMPAAVNVGNIDSARISPAAVTAILAQESFDIGFTSCNGVPIQIITQSQSDNGAPLTDLKKGGFNSGDPGKAIYYQIEMPSVSGVSGGLDGFFSLRSNNPVIVTPDSDNFIFSPKIDIFRDKGSTKDLGSTLTGGFDYTITYK
ncbi:type 1 fimbrial protein [Salmonella enterica subsp. enterica serovar Muenchen]|nr:type 1 fimbrial protein [Salmonella enterica]EDU2576754.1 type 1 fimbrial protein [Salmonella enterica subsp. enterica serovar Saintpaul]EBT6965662.1 type 1 fimbrial protein [Salmonella enterica]EBU3606059.1 type 1 fimbrial protein [Salmonella enterica]ECE3530607.1 type 1 fimbrial protein [Salmonella enterica]